MFSRGDFNARTNCAPDYSLDNDLDRAGNTDGGPEDEIRPLGDYLGACTCYSHRGAPSVIDYMLLSVECRNQVEYFHVHDVTTMSIHCMLSTLIRTNMYYPERYEAALEPLGAKYKWQQQDETKFQAALVSQPCQQLIIDFLNADVNALSASEAAPNVTNIFETAASIAGIRKSGGKKKVKVKQHKKWYDKDCVLIS